MNSLEKKKKVIQFYTVFPLYPQMYLISQGLFGVGSVESVQLKNCVYWFDQLDPVCPNWCETWPHQWPGFYGFKRLRCWKYSFVCFLYNNVHACYLVVCLYLFNNLFILLFGLLFVCLVGWLYIICLFGWLFFLDVC